jgi:hypothetical protein
VKRYAVFVSRFALAVIISGSFVTSENEHGSVVGWAHTVAGFALIYLIIALLLRSVVHRKGRAVAGIALFLALIEAIPGVPRVHAFVSPVLYAVLFWGVSEHGRLRRWWLPALVATAIFFGVGYRYESASVVAHLGAAMLAAGILIGFCMWIQEKQPPESPARGLASVTIAAVIFQVTAGIGVLVIRMIDMDGGLPLAMARTAHFTGAGVLLGMSLLICACPLSSYPQQPPRPLPPPSS